MCNAHIKPSNLGGMGMISGFFGNNMNQRDPLGTSAATSNALGSMGGMSVPMGTSSMGMSGMFGMGMGSYGDPNLTELANNIHSSLSPLPFVNKNGDTKAVLEKLASENPQRLAALEATYGQMYGSPTKLREDLRFNCGGLQGFLNLGRPNCHEVNLLNQSAKVSPYNSAIALQDAMKGPGTFYGIGADQNTVKDIIHNSPDNVLSQTNLCYRGISGGKSLNDDIKSTFLRWIGPEDELTRDLNSSLAGSNGLYY